MPIPLNSTAHILSIRAADTEADPGVLPSQELCSQKGIRIVKPGAHIQHSTMCDAGSEKEKQDILYEILNFMCR
jgi:hypothetical protein